MPFSFSLFRKFLIFRLHHFLKSHTRPATADLALNALSDLTRSKLDLIAENALLRQQLIVLKRQVKRPQLQPGDRFRLVLLASWTPFWKQALHIIQPDTLLRWHRDLFRAFWRRKSKPKRRKLRIAQETITLMKKLAQENRLWGTLWPRIGTKSVRRRYRKDPRSGVFACRARYVLLTPTTLSKQPPSHPPLQNLAKKFSNTSVCSSRAFMRRGTARQ